MKLAIHKSNWGFSPHWIEYCEKKGIPFKIVDCYKSDIIEQVKDCDVLLWHHHHTLAKDKLFAQQLLFALEHSGKRVWPEFNSGWHFDDKVAQKYLLEAINAPLVPTDVFYSRKDAIDYVKNTEFPKVFKLRGGAGSSNVKLLHTKSDAMKFVNRAFGAGFGSYDKWGNLKEVLRKYRLGKSTSREILKSLRRLIVSTEFANIHGKQKGYMLFQKFIPNNTFDIRIIVIGDRAFAIKRMVRENDFRASGSGFVRYDREEMDERCVQISFDVQKRLNASCVAFDYVFDEDNNPLIVEINYGYAIEVYYPCPGYWDRQLNWHEGKFISVHFIIDDIVNSLQEANKV